MKSCLTVTVCAVVTFALATTTHAAVFVDFNLDGTNATRTQSGYQGFEVDNANNGTYNVSQVFTDGAEVGDVTIRVAGNRMRDRSPVTGTHAGLSDLLRDIAHTSGPDFEIGLTFANAGLYDIVLYHHHTNTGSDVTAELTITDADGASAFGTVTTIRGASPSTLSTTSVTINAAANSEVLFDFTNVSGDGFGANGIDIALVPEPASLALLGLGGLLILGGRRR